MELALIVPPFILLAAALASFFLSTIQIRLWARALIWLLGVALLAGAYWLLADHGHHYGLLALIADTLNRPNLAQSVLVRALTGNWAAISGNLAPMFDILLVLAIPLALVALIALTPGEIVEKLVRPPLLFLVGAMFGGAIALGLVAAGLGGSTRDRVYAGILRESDVLDGDTLRMGDVSLRLWGVDAPEYRPGSPDRPSAHNQFCYRANSTAYSCGADSRRALAALVHNHFISCEPPPVHDLNEVQRVESFGRPVVRCLLHQTGAADLDLAQAMTMSGFADIYANDGRREGYYATYVGLARLNHSGMWQNAAIQPLSPEDWRNEDARRQTFIEALPLPQPPS